ncbi:redoxin domain-containing protein [bacterium]|nr:MAG: redoxin domain-containing protein [bacterium]
MLATLALALAVQPMSAPEVGKAAPAFSLTSAKGESHSLSDFKGKVVVLEWVNYGCPFVKKHYGTGTMQALQKSATDRKVVWLQICSSAPGAQGYYEAADALKANEERKVASTAYLFDADGKVGKLYAAKTTPQMFVIDAEGVLRYQGAIDDKNSADPATVKTAKPLTALAIDSVLAGKDPEVTASQPYGCGVKYKD